MNISELGLSIEELDFLIRRKFKGVRNGVHYVLAQGVDEDKKGRLYDRKDATIEQWKIDKYPCPTGEDIARLKELFEDELQTNVLPASGHDYNEDEIIDTGV